MHLVLKKYGNPKWKRNYKYLSRIFLEAKHFVIYGMCKFELHD